MGLNLLLTLPLSLRMVRSGEDKKLNHGFLDMLCHLAISGQHACCTLQSALFRPVAGRCKKWRQSWNYLGLDHMTKCRGVLKPQIRGLPTVSLRVPDHSLEDPIPCPRRPLIVVKEEPCAAGRSCQCIRTSVKVLRVRELWSTGPLNVGHKLVSACSASIITVKNTSECQSHGCKILIQEPQNLGTRGPQITAIGDPSRGHGATECWYQGSESKS